jgi:hypothetical protein
MGERSVQAQKEWVTEGGQDGKERERERALQDEGDRGGSYSPKSGQATRAPKPETDFPATTLPAKSPSSISLIYTAPVIVPVVCRGSHELVKNFYASSGCWAPRLVCGSNSLNSLTELAPYPRPLLIFCRWSPLPFDSVRALSSTAVPSGSHRSIRLTWACFRYFVTLDHHNQMYRGLHSGPLRFTNC